MSEMFAYHATTMSNTLGTSIVVFTRTGFMGILLSHFRPSGTIFAFTNEWVSCSLESHITMQWGCCLHARLWFVAYWNTSWLHAYICRKMICACPDCSSLGQIPQKRWDPPGKTQFFWDASLGFACPGLVFGITHISYPLRLLCMHKFPVSSCRGHN